MSAASDETKLCPMCGREIKAVARKCRFCGEMLDGTSADAAGIWREGRLLVMRKDAELPYRCIKTNTPADVWLKRDLSWAPWWVLVMLALSLPIGLVCYLIVGKRAKIRIGLCEQRRAARIRAICVAWGLVLLGVGLLFYGFASANGVPPSPLWWLVAAGVLTIWTGIIVGMSLPGVIVARRISENYIWLKGVHPDYLAEFPEFLGE
ncbi:MAG: hypothetical protein ACKO3P_22510 [Planctomycetaceae bacterium]